MMAGRKGRRIGNGDSSTNEEQRTNMLRSSRPSSSNVTIQYNPASSTRCTDGGMSAAPTFVNSNTINHCHPQDSVQRFLPGFDKTVLEMNSKLDNMKISNKSQNNRINPSGISSGAISVSKGNVDSQNTQLRRKKTQWNKLDLASGEIVPKIKEQSSTPDLKLPSGPATAFLPFRKLPTELRLKIWGNAARHPRFIEIEYGPKERNGEDLGSVICAGEHYRYRVAPRSRLPPAMFHVCKEAREEAEKIYQLRTFDTMTPNGSERYIYYNPQCDIIYFSNHTCVSNIVSVFCQQPRLPIPRVAINLSAKGLQCCDWDDDNYGVDGGLTFMGALHGIFPPVVRENETRFPGCLGLEEVFWVVQSNLWHLDQGKIDATVSMRHATTNGLTKGQRSFKKHTLFSMKCVKDGAWCAGTNLWTGTENEPKFHFISFAPHPQYDGVSTTYYDGLGVNTPAVQFLGRNNWAVVKKIEKSTGCVITVARQSFRNEEPREIGFMGGEKSIENAKALVLEKLATFEKTIVTKVADVYEDEWLNLRQVREGEL